MRSVGKFCYIILVVPCLLWSSCVVVNTWGPTQTPEPTATSTPPVILPTATSCLELLTRGNSTSGVYIIDPDGTANTYSPMNAYCDMTTDGGGWTLILNYLHQGGSNPALNVLTTSLPVISSSVLGTDESGSATAWGHVAPVMLADITFTSIRFYCVSSGHARVLDFKTSLAACINYFTSGVGNCTAALNASFTALAGHTANMMGSLDGFFGNEGNSALTEFPFYWTGMAHWAMRGQGSRWECDDWAGGVESTLHRTWVK